MVETTRGEGFSPGKLARTTCWSQVPHSQSPHLGSNLHYWRCSQTQSWKRATCSRQSSSSSPCCPFQQEAYCCAKAEANPSYSRHLLAQPVCVARHQNLSKIECTTAQVINSHEHFHLPQAHLVVHTPDEIEPIAVSPKATKLLRLAASPL